MKPQAFATCRGPRRGSRAGVTGRLCGKVVRSAPKIKLPAFPAKAQSRKDDLHSSWSNRCLKVFIVCFALFLCGCAQTRGELEPTPAAAKQFLKLRGYNFDVQAFLSSIAARDLMAVHAFLSAGVNPNAQDEGEGHTALTAAASIGDLPIVVALLKGGADVNLKNRSGSTPFACALAFKHDEVAAALLAQPAVDLNASSANGRTALMIYVWRDREDVVTNLLQRGANVRLQDADGDTALHGAVVTGNVSVLRLLLAKGANVNARNKLGGTPLMWAGSYGRDEVARVLLGMGADALLRDEDGHTAAYWADENRHEELGKFLREAETRKAEAGEQEIDGRTQVADARSSRQGQQQEAGATAPEPHPTDNSWELKAKH